MFNDTLAFLFRWHQRLGLCACLAIVIWTLSGLAHPIISRLNPVPAALSAPRAALSSHQPAHIKDLFTREHIAVIHSLRLFSWDKKSVYRIESNRGIQYFAADNLSVISDGENQYAIYLARHFLGDQQSKIASLELVDNFDEDYLYINRYLPVTKVTFLRPDNARVYIDTRVGRLAAIVDNRKALTSKIFRYMHSWVFISHLQLRKILMTGFLCLGFSASLIGLWLFCKRGRSGIFHSSHSLSRRLHRSLGGVVAVPALIFSFSGLMHLWLSEKVATTAPQLKLSIPGQELDPSVLESVFAKLTITQIELTQIDNFPFWQITQSTTGGAKSDSEHHHQSQSETPLTTPVIYINATTGAELAQGTDHLARFLVGELSDLPSTKIVSIQTLETFTDEYGFINKRLPVQRIDFDVPGSPSLYLETLTNTLASEVHNADRIEGYVFASLHKWHFLDVLGKTLRDILTSIFALGIVIVVVLGTYRYGRKMITHRNSDTRHSQP